MAFATLVAATHVGVVLLPLGGLPGSVLLALAGLPFAAAAAARLRSAGDRTAELVAAQGWTLMAFLLLAAGLSAGLLL